MHPSKCKAQTNRVDWSMRGSVPILPDFSLEVLLDGQCLEVLGTRLSMEDPTKAEIANRMAIGWRKFWALKRLLLNRKVSVKKRMRLFDSTVGNSVLYGTHAWTPREDELRKMRTTQNRMMRKICAKPHHPDQSWLEWVQRGTHKAKEVAAQAGVRDWVVAHATRKWSWAGHVMRRSGSQLDKLCNSLEGPCLESSCHGNGWSAIRTPLA